MKTFLVTVEKEIKVQFDETTPEFKQFLKEYNESITKADEEDISETVAYMVAKYGIDVHVEGIGYLKYRGENQTRWNGRELEEVGGLISIDVDADINGAVDFEVSYTREEEIE